MLPLLLLLACTDPDRPEPADDDTDLQDSDPQDSDPQDSDAQDGDADAWWNHPVSEDEDHDGYSISDGDCNDMNPTVNPGVQTDSCDGVDNNCDGEIDDDVDGDAGEYQVIGDLTDTPEYFLYPTLFPEADVDTFDFYVEDPATSWFDIEVWLYQVPDDADYRLDLYWIEDADGEDRGRVQSADVNGLGGFETINYGGSTGWDDSGWYRITIESNTGASCEGAYQLQFLIGGW